VIEPECDVKIDLLGRTEAIYSARIQQLARTCIRGVIANVFDKQSRFLGHFFSITKVVSVMRLVVSSAGRKNSVSIPLRPHPSCNSHDQGICR
jgi:hypothetical protein